ncbi:2632_t:CDS:2, partial [Entrophospora sp. SA101]
CAKTKEGDYYAEKDGSKYCSQDCYERHCGELCNECAKSTLEYYRPDEKHPNYILCVECYQKQQNEKLNFNPEKHIGKMVEGMKNSLEEKSQKESEQSEKGTGEITSYKPNPSQNNSNPMSTIHNLHQQYLNQAQSTYGSNSPQYQELVREKKEAIAVLEKASEEEQKEYLALIRELGDLLEKNPNLSAAEQQRITTLSQEADNFTEKLKGKQLKDFNEKLQQEWKQQGFTYETCKEWIDIGLKPIDKSREEYKEHLQGQETSESGQLGEEEIEEKETESRSRDREKSNTDSPQQNTIVVSKNQNKTMLESLKGQVERLKVEKIRLIKHMKAEAEKAREATENNEREIQSLHRKEKATQEQKKRLERSNEMQKLMLEKRQKEVLLTTSKLKSVMTLLKRTSTPKSIAKAFRDKSDKLSLDGNSRAIYKYINGRQSLALMDELIQKRDALVSEKHALLIEREKIIAAGNSDNSSDNDDNQDLDDRIEVINSEITYMNARIRAFQSEAARTAKVGTEKQRRRYSPTRKSEEYLEEHPSFTLPKDVTSEASYDTAVNILRNLDPIEAQTVLESFFEDIVKLRSNEQSSQMTLAQQETTMLELRKKLLGMRRAAVLATVEYERRNKDLEEKLKRRGRSPSPVTEENKELKIKTIEDDAVDTISLFDRIYETAFAQVEAATPVSDNETLNTLHSDSRCGSSYFLNNDDSRINNGSPTSEVSLETISDVKKRLIKKRKELDKSLKSSSKSTNRLRKDVFYLEELLETKKEKERLLERLTKDQQEIEKGIQSKKSELKIMEKEFLKRETKKQKYLKENKADFNCSVLLSANWQKVFYRGELNKRRKCILLG